MHYINGKGYTQSYTAHKTLLATMLTANTALP